MITTYPFDDSLRLLKQRQKPARQTQRGNYEWSWMLCGFVTGEFEAATVAWNPSIAPPGPPPRPQILEVLLFGADVPHLHTFVAEPIEDADAWPANVAAYQTAFQTWGNAFSAWALLYQPNPNVGPPPAPVIGIGPRVCSSSVSIVPRTDLFPQWGAVDPGQGGLVSCTYANKDDEQVFVQGFPVTVPNPKCGPGLTLVGGISVQGALLVGYGSATNHGLGISAPTPDIPNPTQPAYIPVLYPKDSYTPAMRAANNIVTIGTASFRIMGLYLN